MSTTLATPADLRGLSQEQILAANFLASYGEPTRSHHAHNLKDFFRFLGEVGLSVDAVKRAHCELYIRHLSETRGLMNSTVANRLATVSGFFKYAMIDGYLPVNPMEYVKRPSVPRLSNTQALTRSELLAVLDAAKKSHPRDHALMCILGLNGLRVGEVVAIDIEDLDRKGGYHVLKVKREKGGETPEVPLAPRTSWAVEQVMYGRVSGPLFLNRPGSPNGPRERRPHRGSALQVVRYHQADHAAQSEAHFYHARFGCRRERPRCAKQRRTSGYASGQLLRPK